MKTITGIMIGCFIFTACGKREKETTYKLETNRAEDMMTSSMREAIPKYLILRVERATGRADAVATNQDLPQTEQDPQRTEEAYGDLGQFTWGEQQAFANGKPVQLQQGPMKLGEAPAQTFYDGGCQFVQQQSDFKLGTPQCAPAYAISKDAGFKYGLGSVSDADKYSFYRFGLKSYFGKDFDYPFTQQQPQFQGQQPQLQGQQPQLQGQQPQMQGQGLPVIQKQMEVPYYQQEPLPTQAVPYQQGYEPGFQGSTSYEPPPIPASAYNGQGHPLNGGQNGSYPMNGGGQGYPLNGGQGYPHY